MAKTANLALRLPPDLKEALEKAAKADMRTVSNYVEILLTSHLQDKGLYARR